MDTENLPVNISFSLDLVINALRKRQGETDSPMTADYLRRVIEHASQYTDSMHSMRPRRTWMAG